MPTFEQEEREKRLWILSVVGQSRMDQPQTTRTNTDPDLCAAPLWRELDAALKKLNLP